MGNYIKQMKAPNLKKQDQSGASEIVIIIGSQAWDFAKHYQASARTEAEITLATSLGDKGEAIPPIVLSDKELKQLNGYQIAPKNARYVRLLRANNAEPLQEALITAICLNLAKNTQAQNVRLYDEAGELLEELSGYIERLRQDDTQAREIVSLALSSEGANNLSPYIEKRTIDGKTGLYRIIPKRARDTDEIVEQTDWLSSPLKVLGVGISESEYYSVLEFTPINKAKAELIAVPMQDIGERTGWQMLKKRGINVTNNQHLKPYLADFLQATENKPIYHIINETGWQNGAYILPNGDVLGEPETPVIFINKSATSKGYIEQGTLADWQREIGQYLRHNPSMMLGVACALSAPLIGLIEADSFGVHLFGGSTAGKTTTANIASSIYGHPDQTRLSWNGTYLGITNEASARNDGFLPLDEIGQGASKKHVEMTAYALFNGVGKVQGAKEGGNRDLTRWRIMAFSTGETDLETYLGIDGIKTNAGQLVRLLNIPISPAKQFYRFGNGKAHADHLNQACKQYYGTIGRAWINWLLTNKSTALTEYQHQLTRWLAMLPDDVSPQVKRVAGRFAILETALQLASPLTQWEREENSTALSHSFNEWVSVFGFHSREEKQVIEQVNGWLLRNGARFIEFPLNLNRPEPRDTAGYKQLAIAPQCDEQYWVFPQVYIQDVIKGFNEKQANEILLRAGMLKQGKEKGRKYLNRLPKTISGGKTIRCYVLEILDEEAGEESEEKE